jgi:hypothetical protein
MNDWILPSHVGQAATASDRIVVKPLITKPGTLGAQKRRACGDFGPGKLFFKLFNLWSRLCSGDSEILDIDMYKNLPDFIAGRR